MPRRRTIYVDEIKLLARIAKYTAETLAELKNEADRLEAEFYADRSGDHKWKDCCILRRILSEINELGIKYDLRAFAGRELTPSERIRHQEAIRRLEARGLVTLYGERASRLQINAAGQAAVEHPTDA